MRSSSPAHLLRNAWQCVGAATLLVLIDIFVAHPNSTLGNALFIVAIVGSLLLAAVFFMRYVRARGTARHPR